MWRWAWWLLALLLCSSCASGRFRPSAPRLQPISVGQARPLRAEDAGKGQGEVTLETELAPGTRLLRVGEPSGRVDDDETGITDERCVDPQASLQTIDGVPRHQIDPPELSGRHTLTLNRRPSAVPIALETERLGQRHCDHVASGWPHAWQREPFWYGDVRLSFVGIVPRFSVGGLRLLVARYTGPLRLGAEVGLANSVVCSDDTLDCPSYFALPLGIEASVSTYQQSAVFLTAGGRFTTLFAQQTEGGRLDLRSFVLQATGEILLGSSLREGLEPAPAGFVLGMGADVGPAIVLGQDDGLGLALGVHLSYAFAP